MSDAYELLDSIRDEIDTLKELEKVYDKDDAWIFKAVVIGQQRSLRRILNRYEKGHEYYMGVKDGKPQLMYRQTTRHLEREFPAVARAKQNLDTVVAIVKDDANEN